MTGASLGGGNSRPTQIEVGDNGSYEENTKPGQSTNLGHAWSATITPIFILQIRSSGWICQREFDAFAHGVDAFGADADLVA